MDIKQATVIARTMITEYGMSEKLGFQLLSADGDRHPWEPAERAHSDQTAKFIDEEIKALIDCTYANAKQMLEAHREQLQRVAEALLRYETLTRKEVDVLMQGQELRKATVADILEAEQAKSECPKGTSGDDLPEEQTPGSPNTVPSPA